MLAPVVERWVRCLASTAGFPEINCFPDWEIGGNQEMRDALYLLLSATLFASLCMLVWSLNP